MQGTVSCWLQGAKRRRGDSVRSLEEYWKLATENLRLARAVADPQSKAMLLQMAATWIRLAERLKAKAEKEAA